MLLLATAAIAWVSMPVWQWTVGWLQPIPSLRGDLALTMALWGGFSAASLGITATQRDGRMGRLMALFLVLAGVVLFIGCAWLAWLGRFALTRGLDEKDAQLVVALGMLLYLAPYGALIHWLEKRSGPHADSTSGTAVGDERSVEAPGSQPKP
jgi:hypothetical protein